MAEPGGWIGFVPGGDNPHLTPEQREQAERTYREMVERRGQHLARVVVDVYENGEAAPQVQFPKGSTIDLLDRAGVTAVIAQAAEALKTWR